MFIDGKKVTSSEGEFEVRSPIDTSIVLGYFQKGTREHARQAIASAEHAFQDWSNRDWRERVAIIRKAAEIMSGDLYPLAALITYEVGKNRYEAIAEVGEAADFFRYYSDQMEANGGFMKETGPGAPGENCRSVMRPHGVWVVISPFNFPNALACGMMTGALITGNTVVFKPTSDAPFSALKLYEVLIRAGIPAGVINFVTGPGGNFGDEVTHNPDVAGIAFTGSKDVGMKLYRDLVQYQNHPKPFISEMGSKNPSIVTAKADLDKAVEGVVRAAFGYGGQKCSANARVYVDRSIKDAFITKLRKRTSELKLGDPREKDVFVGPVVNKRALDNYQRYIDLAQKDGGKFITGGAVARDGMLSKGYFATPTVITGLLTDHRLFKEELFVPILLVDEYESLEDALRKANDTEYGLTAGIFSEDEREVEEFFRKIEFGVTYSNREGGATTGAWPGAQSFGGWKASGATGRGVGGPYYLIQFLREQAQTRVK
jgi:1-pyrroline-5-carboxylate dehydrogenase